MLDVLFFVMLKLMTTFIVSALILTMALSIASFLGGKKDD